MSRCQVVVVVVIVDLCNMVGILWWDYFLQLDS